MMRCPVDFKSHAPYCCEFELHQVNFILLCEEVIHLAYKTSVVLLWTGSHSSEIMQGGTPEVFLYYRKLENLPYDLFSIRAT